MALEHDNWQNLYTTDQASWKDLGNSLRIVLPLVSGMLFVAFSSFLFFIAKKINPEQDAVSLLYILGVTMIPVIIAGIGLKLIFKAAVIYFKALYKSSEDEKSVKLIKSRLFGIPPLPALLNTVFHHSFVVAVNGEIQKDDEYAKWLGGPAILVIMDGTALYLERGNCFSRIVGPGVAFLEKYETVKDAVDLRPQTYTSKVEAWTKDGIKVSFVAKIVCRIGDPNQTNSSNELVPVAVEDDGKIAGENTPIFPCDRLSTRKAIEWTKIKRTLNEKDQSEELYPSKWLDGAWGKIQGRLANYISKRHLENLFVSFDRGSAGQILSSQERERLRIELNRELMNEAGIALIEIQIEKFTIEPHIHKKRIEKWTSEWKAKADIREATTDAEGTKAIEKARAEAQHDLIIEIANGLSSAGPDTFYDSALLALSGLLEQHLNDPYASSYLNEAIEKIQEILKG